VLSTVIEEKSIFHDEDFSDAEKNEQMG